MVLSMGGKRTKSYSIRPKKTNPKRNSGPLLPAKVRINPRTGKVQVFVSPKVAAQVKGNGKRKRNPLKQYEVRIPPGKLGSYRLAYVAPNSTDAKRRALQDYNRSLSSEGFATMKSLPRGTKVVLH